MRHPADLAHRYRLYLFFFHPTSCFQAAVGVSVSPDLIHNNQRAGAVITAVAAGSFLLGTLLSLSFPAGFFLLYDGNDTAPHLCRGDTC